MESIDEEEYKAMLADKMSELNDLIGQRAEKQFEKFGFKEVNIDIS